VDDAAATILTLSSATLISLGIVSAAALRGWNGWLDVKRMECADGRPGRPAVAPTEIRDLRERVRKLEAIASGVDF
jgi:hypothetical protein